MTTKSPQRTTALVVARYQEDVRWIRNIPVSVDAWIYNKGETIPGFSCVQLPNTGREAHTYLHHIVTHYHALPDVMVFCQGHPFDHAPELHRFLRELIVGSGVFPDFRWLGFLVDTDDCRGRNCFVPWSKNAEGRELPLDEFYQSLFSCPSPEKFHFYGGGQFAITRECVHRRPRSFYEHALKVALEFPDAAHCFERCWDKVFGVRGVDPGILNSQGRAYLKPIRRLGGMPASGVIPATGVMLSPRY